MYITKIKLVTVPQFNMFGGCGKSFLLLLVQNAPYLFKKYMLFFISIKSS
jgi:hypothetical protein